MLIHYYALTEWETMIRKKWTWSTGFDGFPKSAGKALVKLSDFADVNGMGRVIAKWNRQHGSSMSLVSLNIGRGTILK